MHLNDRLPLGGKLEINPRRRNVVFEYIHGHFLIPAAIRVTA